MTLYVVYRIDRRDGKAAAIRAKTRPLHQQYMEQFRSRVRLGGPILDASGIACGGLMLMEAQSEDEVRSIVAGDPFEKAALSVRIDIHPFRWQTSRPADMPPL